MIQRRTPSEQEKRLSSEVFARAEKSEKFSASYEITRCYFTDLEDRRKKYEEENERQTKHLLILARILFIPIVFLVCGYLLLIGSGLYFGEIVNISKYGGGDISLQSEPIYFWVTFTYHSSIAVLFSWAAYRLGRATKWFSQHASNFATDTDGQGRRSS